MKRFCSLLLIVMMVLTVIPSAAFAAEAEQTAEATQGSCGTNVNWELDSEGTLRISGSGAISNYSSSKYVPWYEHRTEIKEVVIEEGVTNVGDFAFSGCISLTGVTIPDSVTIIGSAAFENCSSLQNIALGNGIKSIGENTFYGCSSLTSIVIPEGVTSIGGFAFDECSSLIDITIPASVTSIGEFAFYGCSSLTGIIIPEGVTSINNNSLKDCTSLRSVTIPDSVTGIGEYAFSGCDSLISITLPDGVTSIGYGAFSGCSNLTDLTIPGSVTFIDEYAFKDCSSLTSIIIPEGVTSINKGTFKGCTGLKSVTIPNSVKSIFEEAFYDCNSLTGVTIPAGVTSIGRWAFGECSSLTGVTLFEGVTSIGDYAFSSSGLTGVTIPDSVASIGSGAFSNCSSLQNVTLGNGITSIGEEVFYACSSLISITIPDGVTSIGAFAFYDCSSLTGITIPDSVKRIGPSAFCDCNNLKEIHISSLNAWMSISFEGWDANPLYYADNGLYINGERISESIVIPEGVTSINEYTFSGCSSLTGITIPVSVTSIGNNAFWECSGLRDVYYAGTESDWGTITIDPENSCLQAATIHYNHTHDYSSIQPTTVAATCTGEGYTEYTCVYGETYREIIPALGHTKPETGTVTAPTCTEKGYTTYICERCGESHQDDFVDALGHDYSEQQDTISPTCTEQGYTVYRCSRCDSEEQRDFVNEKGHTNAVHQAVAPTCTETGLTNGAYCADCGTVFVAQTEVAALGHDWDEEFNSKEPTCTEQGSYSHTCIRCGTTEDVVVDALGHTVVTDKAVAATCTETGLSEGKHCSVCGTKTVPQKIVPAKGHKEVIDAAVKPTYDKTGLTEGKHCSVCGEVTVAQKDVPMLKVSSPTGVKAASAGYSSIKISWSKVTGATGYTVYRSTSKSGTYSAVTHTASLSYTNSGRTTGTTYYYKVRAYRTVSGVKKYGNYSSVVYAKPIPAVPTGVKAASAGYNSIKVSWGKVTGATGYTVYRSTSKSGKYSAVANTTKLSYTNSGRTTGKTYYYKVRAYRTVNNVKKYGNYSSVVYAKPIPAKPVITAKNAGSKKIRITWKKVTGATGYEVYRATSKSGTYKRITTIAKSSAVSYTNTKLTKGKTYFYKVRAYKTVSGKKVYGSYSSVKYAKG